MRHLEIPLDLDPKKLRIAVLGLGHVGLPTALGFSDLGWDVIGADSDSNKVSLLRQGKCTFYEPGLQELLEKCLAHRKFQITDDVEAAIRSASVLFLCVGTPQGENGEADLSEVERLARIIARSLNGYKLIVEKSTVPAITGRWIRKTVLRYARVADTRNGANGGNGKNGGNGHQGPLAIQAEPNIDVASNPEFLQEGRALEGFYHPDRIVCGVESDVARDILSDLYRPLHARMLFTDVTTAELIKHAANAFLATKISFINMVADICEAVGGDVTKVAAGIGLDSRIGASFLRAGIGFGGYCFPKDLRAFIHLAEENQVDASMLREVESINQRRIDEFVRKVREALWVLQGKKIGVLGLAFKAGTDDVREAPALKVIEALLRQGAVIQAFDPKALEESMRVLPEVPGRLQYVRDAYEAATGAHALLVLTEWQDFRQLDLAKLRELMEVSLIIDGRNLFEPAEILKAGFEYMCVGRTTASASPLLIPEKSSPAPAYPASGPRPAATTLGYTTFES